MTKTADKNIQFTLQLIEANPAASAIFDLAVNDYKHYVVNQHDEGWSAFWQGRYDGGVNAIAAVTKGINFLDISEAVKKVAEEELADMPAKN